MANVAFIGLGVMGYPMAGHLVRAGHTVRVYNRTGSKAEVWCAEHAPRFVTGGTEGDRAPISSPEKPNGDRAPISSPEKPTASVASSPAAAAVGADAVFVCVGNDDDVRMVVLGPDGALGAMQPGSVLVDHTTASADLARDLHAAATDKGVGFVDAPVSGGQAGAQNGALTVMCGGQQEHYDAIAPIIDAYARMHRLLGGPGSGQLTKMVNQLCIAGLVQGLAEGVDFGRRAGLDMDAVIDVISKGAAQSWQMENRARTMAKGEFAFGFAVEWMRKDLGICLDEARRIGARLPVAALVDQFYAQVEGRGGRRWDTSSLINLLTQP